MNKSFFRINERAIKNAKLDEIIFSDVDEFGYPEIIELSRKISAAVNSSLKIQVGSGLIFALLFYIKLVRKFFTHYEKKYDSDVFKKAFDFSVAKLGPRDFIRTMDDFVRTFPPEEIFKNKLSVEEYIWQRKNGHYNYENEIAESIIIYLLNENPALRDAETLFSVSEMKERENFEKYVNALYSFAEKEPKINNNLDFLSFLLEPIKKYPNDFQAQLNFIVEKWSEILGDEFSKDFLFVKDLFKEDVIRKAGNVPPQTVVPKYLKTDNSVNIGLSEIAPDELAEDYREEKRFTPDTAWMPNVVMIAKNTLVWLDQLSKKYGRKISRLDEIPDEELQTLSEYNINALWLIGIWERSSASKKIKQLRGNKDATASAYSLYDYEIARELGGKEAYYNLNERAKKYGIRLAADMVPNHTGIYSKWILEHPDYFIQTKKPPFPNYSFTGENLSPNPDLTIRIEDGYWTNSDAAVVFQRIDNGTGDTRYIYHGNDGTSMPWNDTAQLDILKAEVREAVIQEILRVARKFSVIRFDAAMTLTKKHFARLWYPEPGKGGDIPSRVEYSMTREEFNKFFPKEFWREVVDRIQAEMPETLLLAEAFWLMEGYFVRTLGMHRVYNSAFMNMLMREENSKYRELIKNTLEFEPEILKRYVNFMSNPDEETAIKQFGAGDKYFGVLTLMTTLPGLPMFAHGQIEGYTEKYGMEYVRAYYDEEPNTELVERHKREIFPILAQRKLFAEVENFWFYDFKNGEETNENVFAYSNLLGEQRALVFYNNKYERAYGKINFSTKKLVNDKLVSVSLFDALKLKNEPDLYIIAKEKISDKEFIFKPEDFTDGFEIALNGFEYRVFSDFEFVRDESNFYETLYKTLNLKGVSSLETEKEKLKLKPLHDAIYNLFEDETFDELVEYFDLEGIEKEETVKRRFKFFLNKFNYLLNQALYYCEINDETTEYLEKFEEVLHALLTLRKDLMHEIFELDKIIHKSLTLFFEHNYRANLTLLILAIVKKSLLEIAKKHDKGDLLEKIIFDEICSEVIKHLGKSEYEIEELKLLIDILGDYKNHPAVFINAETCKENDFDTAREHLSNLLENDAVLKFLRLNEYKKTVYFRKENLEEILDWFLTLDIIELYKNKNCVELGIKTTEDKIRIIKNTLKSINRFKILSEDSSFKFENLKKSLSAKNESIGKR